MPRGVRSSVAEDDERRRAPRGGGTSRVERRVSETLRRPRHVRRYGELSPRIYYHLRGVACFVFRGISLKRENIIPAPPNRHRCRSERRSNTYPSSRNSIYPPRRDSTTAGATLIPYSKRRCAATIRTIVIFTSWYARGRRPAVPRRTRGGKRVKLGTIVEQRFPIRRHSTKNIRCCVPSARRCSWKPHDFVTHSDGHNSMHYSLCRF